MTRETTSRLDRLENAVRSLADDRAAILVKQLRGLSERDVASNATVIDDYLRELERTVQKDLGRLSEEDRSLVGELFHLLRSTVSALRPGRLRQTLRRTFVGVPASSVDDFGRNEEYIERLRPLADFLFYRYWRIEVEGLENVPSAGPGLLIANHSGFLPFDAWMVQYAVQELHPSGRPVRFLLEEWFTKLPFLSYVLTRLGMVRGSQDNARRLVDAGELVGSFPEGLKGVAKPFRDRYHLARFGRGGTVRLAMKTGAPVIPVAVLGAEETYPILFTSGFIANALRVPYFPFTPLFPWLGPLGVLPLPSKWYIRFGETFDLGDFSSRSWEDDILVNTLNEELRATIQNMVSDLVQQRRNTFLG